MAEAFGIWAFAFYSFVKNKEMHLVQSFLEKQGMVRLSNAATQNEVAKAGSAGYSAFTHVAIQH